MLNIKHIHGKLDLGKQNCLELLPSRKKWDEMILADFLQKTQEFITPVPVVKKILYRHSVLSLQKYLQKYFTILILISYNSAIGQDKTLSIDLVNQESISTVIKLENKNAVLFIKDANTSFSKIIAISGKGEKLWENKIDLYHHKNIDIETKIVLYDRTNKDNDVNNFLKKSILSVDDFSYEKVYFNNDINPISIVSSNNIIYVIEIVDKNNIEKNIHYLPDYYSITHQKNKKHFQFVVKGEKAFSNDMFIISKIDAVGNVSQFSFDTEVSPDKIIGFFPTPAGLSFVLDSSIGDNQQYEIFYLELKNKNTGKYLIQLPRIEEKSLSYNRWVFAGFDVKNNKLLFYKKIINKQQIVTYYFTLTNGQGQNISNLTIPLKLANGAIVRKSANYPHAHQGYLEDYEVIVKAIKNPKKVVPKYDTTFIPKFEANEGLFGDVYTKDNQLFIFGEYTYPNANEESKGLFVSKYDINKERFVFEVQKNFNELNPNEKTFMLENEMYFTKKAQGMYNQKKVFFAIDPFSKGIEFGFQYGGASSFFCLFDSLGNFKTTKCEKNRNTLAQFSGFNPYLNLNFNQHYYNSKILKGVTSEKIYTFDLEENKSIFYKKIAYLSKFQQAQDKIYRKSKSVPIDYIDSNSSSMLNYYVSNFTEQEQLIIEEIGFYGGLINIYYNNDDTIQDFSFLVKEVLFDKASHLISATYRLELDKVVAFLQNNLTVNIKVSGHADEQGNSLMNLSLSENRKNEVINYLVRQGIAVERIKSEFLGNKKPRFPNTNEVNRALNRRVEIIIVE